MKVVRHDLVHEVQSHDLVVLAKEPGQATVDDGSNRYGHKSPGHADDDTHQGGQGPDHRGRLCPDTRGQTGPAKRRVVGNLCFVLLHG